MTDIELEMVVPINRLSEALHSFLTDHLTGDWEVTEQKQFPLKNPREFRFTLVPKKAKKGVTNGKTTERVSK